jgi:hypothetical protein
MGARNTFKLLVLIIVAGSIWLAGCKKTSPVTETPSIVGTWGVDSLGQVLKANNVVLFDSTVPSGSLVQLAITFSADGYYTEFTNKGIIGSAYTLYGTALSLYDTIGGANKWDRFTVPVLTENRLLMTGTDTSGTGDTISSVTFIFSR